ncbi:hypothetical protein [Flavobacterium cerinum]|uniref:Uncharacterized protein n=1 Tax=Flavobacterium cerinum TaxID=2502784 RepID=A0ABY5IPS2_9FLAO|nr:hypothetical protein [Flavobacterium cerinum]UUC44197.1 hypothetical protein NOX80_11190 [Flavobacterium cerinum]
MELDEQQEELFRKRQKGILPEIEFPGQIYVIDWRERVLRAKDKIEVEPIRISERKRGFYGDNNFLIYDTRNRNVIEYKLEEPYSVANLVVLNIPGGLTLDPVGVARENGLDERKFAAIHPLTQKIVAKVVPVSRAEIRRLIGIMSAKPSEGEAIKKNSRKGKGI